MYVKSNLHCTNIFDVITDNYFNDSLLDVAGVLFSTKHTRITVLAVYRPPNCPLSCMNDLELFVVELSCTATNIICMGDFNIDFNNVCYPG